VMTVVRLASVHAHCSPPAVLAPLPVAVVAAAAAAVVVVCVCGGGGS